MADRYPFLNSRHPSYEEREALWERNERRMRGGVEVPEHDLWEFQWEEKDNEGKHDHWKRRRDAANYVNLPRRMGIAFAGRLLTEHPQVDTDLNFGRLGDVTGDSSVGQKTRARQFFESVDAPVGGTTWPAWWFGVGLRAMATGHRWILADAPPAPADREPTRRDELNGFRPYLVEYSPLSVPDWHYEQGILQWARIEITQRSFEYTGTRTNIGEETQKLLLVRRGWDAFGPQFAEGGWWWIDEKGRTLQDSDGNDRHATFDRTNGEIPMVPYFYERQDANARNVSSISRPGITELANVAVSLMNLDSAADFDAFEAASRLYFLMNADPKTHNTILSQLQDGSQFISVPPPSRGSDVPTDVKSFANVTANEAIERRIKKKIEQGRIIAMEEATWAPDSSGVSKKVGFRDVKAPRLALMAINAQDAQTPAINLVERLWTGEEPEGHVSWTTDFDLEPFEKEIMRIFDGMSAAQANSPTLKAEGLLKLAEEGGVLDRFDDDLKTKIREELVASAQNATRAQQATGDIFGPQNEA